MTTTSSETNLSQLVINELTQEEYEALTPEDNQLYLTPDESANQDLSNVSSIDSNSAVQTALDGKVSKSGDTMTGMLTIETNDNLQFAIKNKDITRGVAPASTEYEYIRYLDKNGDVLGGYYYRQHTDGGVSIRQYCQTHDGSSNSVVSHGFDSSGNAYFSFPKTTCCDGQWVAWATTILNDESLNASTNLTKTLAVPNDGHVYEVLFSAAVVTGSTSGNAIYCTLATNKVSSVNVCGCRTRTASTVTSRGGIILPISYATNNLTITRSTGQNGTCDLVTRAYRRIGTNT